MGARHLAYAADHAALVDAFVRLAEATGEARWIELARQIANALIELFWDDERAGLFTTGIDAEHLDPAIDMVVRVVLSHVMQPSSSPEQTGADIAWLAGRVLGSPPA